MTDSFTLIAGAALVVASVLVFFFGVLSPRLTGALVILTLSLPAFIDMASGLPTITRVFSGGSEVETGLHISFGLLALAALPSLARRRGVLPGGRHLWLLALLFTLSIGLGLLSGAGRVGFLYYLQTMTPLLAWIVVSRSGIGPDAARRAVMWGVSSGLAIVAGASLLLTGTLSGSLETVTTLSAAIPQYRNYFPFIVMIGVAFAVAGWRRHRAASVVLLGLSLLVLPLIWSRTGLAMILLAAAIAFLYSPSRSTRSARAVMLVVGAVPMAYYVLNRAVEGVLGARGADSADLSVADGTRGNVALEAIERIIDRPLFGDMFLPAQSVTAGGVPTAQPILYPAHNQYLDIALRGGVLALLVTIALMIMYILRARRLATDSDPAVATFHAAMLAVVVAAVFGNMTQLYLVQPWTGGLLLALLGVSSGLVVRQSETPISGPGVTVAAVPLRSQR